MPDERRKVDPPGSIMMLLGEIKAGQASHGERLTAIDAKVEKFQAKVSKVEATQKYFAGAAAVAGTIAATALKKSGLV